MTHSKDCREPEPAKAGTAIVFSAPVMMDAGGTPSCTMTGFTALAAAPCARAVGRKPVFSISAVTRNSPPPRAVASAFATLTFGKSDAR